MLTIIKQTRHVKNSTNYLNKTNLRIWSHLLEKTWMENFIFCTVRVEGLRACNFIKKRFQQMCFLVNFEKFVRTCFFIERIRKTACWFIHKCFKLKVLVFLFPLSLKKKMVKGELRRIDKRDRSLRFVWI